MEIDQRFVEEGELAAAVDAIVSSNSMFRHDLLQMEAYRKRIKPVPRRVAKWAADEFRDMCREAGIQFRQNSLKLKAMYRVAGILWDGLDEEMRRQYLTGVNG